MYLSACQPKVSRVKICLDTFKKHKNRDTQHLWSRAIEILSPTSTCTKIISFQNIMSLPKYCDALKWSPSYWEDNCFSFSPKFALAQFKFILAEFKYPIDCNGLKINFRTPTKDRRKNTFTSYVFMYLTLPIWTPLTDTDIVSKLVPCLWKHDTWPIQFTLVVSNFGINMLAKNVPIISNRL